MTPRRSTERAISPAAESACWPRSKTSVIAERIAAGSADGARLLLERLGLIDPALDDRLRQSDDLAVPRLDHAREGCRVAVAQLLDGVDADGLQHLGVTGPDAVQAASVA